MQLLEERRKPQGQQMTSMQNPQNEECWTLSVKVSARKTHAKRDQKTRHLKSVVYISNSFVTIHDKEQNVVQGKCFIMLESLQEKPVERPWRFLKDLQILVGIICRNIFLG
jgi:hypothetical protein